MPETEVITEQELTSGFVEYKRCRQVAEDILDVCVPEEEGMRNFFLAQEIITGIGVTPTPLDDLADACHAAAIKKGFYDAPTKRTHLLASLALMIDLCDVTRRLEILRKGNDPALVHVPRILSDEELERSLKLLLIASEVAEAFEALLAGDAEQEASEVADIAIRLFDYAGWREIGLDSEVATKMRTHAGRTS